MMEINIKVFFKPSRPEPQSGKPAKATFGFKCGCCTVVRSIFSNDAILLVKNVKRLDTRLGFKSYEEFTGPRLPKLT